MERDRWCALGVVGTRPAYVACLTPATVLAPGAVGLGAQTFRLPPAEVGRALLVRDELNQAQAAWYRVRVRCLWG